MKINSDINRYKGKSKYYQCKKMIIFTIIVMFLVIPSTSSAYFSADNKRPNQISSDLEDFSLPPGQETLTVNYCEGANFLKSNCEAEGDLFKLQIRKTAPLPLDWIEQLKRSKADLIGYLGDSWFLIRNNEYNLRNIRSLPFIVDVVEYLPQEKFSYEIINRYIVNSVQDQDMNTFIVKFHSNENPINSVNNIRNKVLGLGGQINSISGNLMEINIDHRSIEKLAEQRDIIRIEAAPKFVYFNNVTSGIIDTESVWSNVGLDGLGQIVTVCDTGLDNGSYSDLHEDFRGRLLHAYALGGRSGAWSDDDIWAMGQPVGGHGTHVAGSVLGGGNWSAGKIRGMAYNASLVMQSTMTSSGGMNIPMNMYQDLYYPPYDSYNSRIHTNSWGDPFSAGEYNEWSNETDGFIWDYQDMIILFASGNEVMGITDTSTPGTAKNVITVGASESYRPDISFPSRPGIADDKDQLASFSCYSTEDNRLKPDVIAPGTGILSTRSSLIASPNSNYWLGYDAFYAYAGGTSMSTPITAGAVALIRQYFTDIENVEPSAALVKAALINGAEDMPVAGGTQPIPNYKEGWGRINISKSIAHDDPGVFLYIDNKTGLVSLKNFTYSIEVKNDSVPLNISLVWTDYPASAGASTTLVNDLHLNITHSKSGISYKGNVFQSGWSSNDDSDANSDWDKYDTGYDNINNVECLRIKNPEIGRYKLTIVGSNVPLGPQPFAVVISGGIEDKLLAPSNLAIEADPNGNALNLTWDRVFGPEISKYELFRSTQPDSGYTKINVTAGPGVRKYHDIGLIDGTEYYYKLKTVDILNTRSNFSEFISGKPADSIAPWINISKPKSNEKINKNSVIKYTNDSDCTKIIFRFYNDTNKNGLEDDNNSWDLIGIDHLLNGTFNWDTRQFGLGYSTGHTKIIFSAESLDEADNSLSINIPEVIIDNEPPEPPTLNTFANPTNQTHIAIMGENGPINGEVRLYSKGVEIGSSKSISKSGYFTIDINLTEGSHNINARALDSIGNGPGPSSNEILVVIDTTPPIAHAGGTFVIDEDTWFTFNASQSFDPNSLPEYNKIISYFWYFKNFNDTEVRFYEQEASYFFDTMGNYTVHLLVQDMAGNWGGHEFWLLVNDKTKPTINITGETIWDEDKYMEISANSTIDNDPEFNLTGNFSWSFFDYDPEDISKGKINKIMLTGITFNYVFQVPDEYILLLNVTDASGNWNTELINITIRDTTQPVAEAGPDMAISKGRTITLDASSSMDNDPHFFKTGNFTWQFNYIGEYIFLYGLKHDFRFKKDNVFKIILTVTDKWGNKNSDELFLRVDADLDFPYVTWTYPNDYSENVAVTSLIKLKLNETLDIENIPLNRTTFQVFDSKDREVRGEILYEPIDSLIVFVPNNVLRFSETYTVFLISTVKDLAGNRLDGNKNGFSDPVAEDNFKFVFRTVNMTKEPKENKKDVPLDTKIKIGFDGEVSENALDNIEFSLREKKTQEEINGSLNIDMDDKTIVFEPKNKLDPSSVYEVNLLMTFYVLDIAEINWETNDRMLVISNNLNNESSNETINSSSLLYSWSFTTASSDADEGIFNLPMFTLISLIILIFIIILIIITVFIFVQKKKELSKAEFVDEEKGLDYYDEDGEYRPYPEYYNDEGYEDYDHDHDYDDWSGDERFLEEDRSIYGYHRSVRSGTGHRSYRGSRRRKERGRDRDRDRDRDSYKRGKKVRDRKRDRDIYKRKRAGKGKIGKRGKRRDKKKDNEDEKITGDFEIEYLDDSEEESIDWDIEEEEELDVGEDDDIESEYLEDTEEIDDVEEIEADEDFMLTWEEE